MQMRTMRPSTGKRKDGLSSEAITRRLSPLEQTATVSDSKSTYEHGAGLKPEEILEEMLSREKEKVISYGKP